MVAASNACIPADAPVTAQVPPLPNTVRGEPCPLDGTSGKQSADKAFLSYPSGKLCIVRSMDGELAPGAQETTLPNSDRPILVYRGHQYSTSSVSVAPSGSYACSGDTRGKVRVWALDHEEHLCKLDIQGLSSTVRDISWDGESKRIAFAGDRLDNQSICTKAIQWDTGNTQGSLYQHARGKSCAVAFKPNRPFRLVTGGKEDGKVHFHSGPPFQKVAVENGVPCMDAHVKGINCIRYNSDGSLVASVGGDKALCIYDGKDLALKCKVDGIHNGTVYSCAWASDNFTLMTSSADGTCKLFEVSKDGTSVKETQVYNVAEHQLGKSTDKAPRGGMQLGCTFVGGTTPVSVSTNNQIAVMPKLGSSSSTIKILTGHNAPIGAVAFDHTNGLFFTGDSDGILCKWDLKTIKALERVVPADNLELMYQVHGGAVSGLTVFPDATVMSVGWDDTAYFTDGKSNKLQSNKVDITAQPVAVSTGTCLTAIATVKGIMLLKDGKMVSKGVLPVSYTIKCILVSKDDKTIFAGGDDCKIYVYAPIEGTNELRERHVISDGHLKPVHSLALSNDQSMLAAGDVRDVCVYKTADFSTIVGKSKWCFHLQIITSLAWSPDDKYIASGGTDDSLFVWCPEKKMRRLHYPFAHRGGIVGLTFRKDTPDKLNIVSAGADSCVVQWDVTDDVKTKFG